MLGKRIQGQKLLLLAVQEAAMDNILLPFVENYTYLKKLLECCAVEKYSGFFNRIIQLGEEYEVRMHNLNNKNTRPSVLSVLTEQEYEIVILLQKRLSNREIGERLFLSEGSVKQYVNRIYSKLQIGGDNRTKRKQLLELLSITR